MSALAFWKAMVGDRSGFLDRIVATLEQSGVPYCVIGGVAVNAYTPSSLTQDLDIVLAADDLPRVVQLLAEQYRIREFEHSINVYDPDSALQAPIQKDASLETLLGNARRMVVDDLDLPVASPEDLFRLKVAAAMDPTRRMMKKGKDWIDLAKLIVAFPHLRPLLPQELEGEVLRFVDDVQE